MNISDLIRARQNVPLIIMLGALFACLSPAGAARLQGVIVNEASEPLAGATIELVADMNLYWIPEDLEPLARAVSRPDGTFQIDAATSGTTALIASATEYRRAKFPINVDAAGNRQLGLALQKGVQLGGRVTDESGSPVAGVRIGPIRASLDTSPDLAQRILPEWVESDAQGKFQFSAILPNVNVTFLAHKQGFEANNVSMRAGETQTTFRILRGGFSVAGTVFSRGMPDGNYIGTAVRLNGNGFDMATRCGKTSEYQIQGIPAGEYSLEPVTDGGRQGRAAVVSFPKDDATSVGLEIASGYYVEGTTIDFETSTPIAGVVLQMRDQVSTSAQSGSFRIGPFFIGGPVDISVDENSGFRNADLGQPIEYPNANGFANVTGISIRVLRRRTIHATLSNIEGTTQPVIVYLHSRTGEAKRVTASTTSALLAVYQPGDYLVYARSGALASEATTVSLRDSHSAAVQLALEPAASVRGMVQLARVDAASTRVRTASIRVLSSAETSAAIKLTETEIPFGKSFSFRALPFGRLTIEAANASLTQRQVRNVDLRPGELTELQFEFLPGKTFAGTVVDAEQHPLPAVGIQYHLPGGRIGHTETKEDGSFQVEDLMSDEISQVMVDHYAYLPFRAGPIALPRTTYQVVLKKAGLLRARVEAGPTTQWKIYLMQSTPWGSGSYPEQWMSRPMDTKSVDGGETAELSIPGAGRYRFVALGGGRSIAVSESFELKENETAGREFSLTVGVPASVSGSVGTGGVATAEVTAWNTSLPEGQVESEFRVKSINGTYEINDLPPGDYLLMAAGENVSASAVNVIVTAGETKRVDLTASQLLQISGTVMLNAQPVSQARVELISETDSKWETKSVQTNAAGAFQFEELQADTYTVRATVKVEKDELSAQRSINAKRGATIPAITLDLTPPPTVQVTVPAGVNVAPGTAITFMNTETRNTVPGQWINGQLQAPLRPGVYEVWNGDMVAGNVTVGTGNSAAIMPLAPAQ